MPWRIAVFFAAKSLSWTFDRRSSATVDSCRRGSDPRTVNQDVRVEILAPNLRWGRQWMAPVRDQSRVRVTEDRAEIRRRNVLVDGDDQGYLLQIFTKNLIGPIFIEIIQRKNHLSFGEGNFGALFRSIERDQAKRGVFDDARA
jgi:hypothetical protein